MVGRPDSPASITASGTSETGARNGSRKAWQAASSRRRTAGASIPTRQSIASRQGLRSTRARYRWRPASPLSGRSRRDSRAVEPACPRRLERLEGQVGAACRQRRAEIADAKRASRRRWQQRRPVDLGPQQPAGRQAQPREALPGGVAEVDHLVRPRSAQAGPEGRTGQESVDQRQRQQGALAQEADGPSRSNSLKCSRGLAMTSETGAPSWRGRRRASRAAPVTRNTRSTGSAARVDAELRRWAAAGEQFQDLDRVGCSRVAARSHR